jgi:hypothetical protein
MVNVPLDPRNAATETFTTFRHGQRPRSTRATRPLRRSPRLDMVNVPLDPRNGATGTFTTPEKVNVPLDPRNAPSGTLTMWAGEIVAAELPWATAYLAGAGGSAATSLLDCGAADNLTRDQAPASRVKQSCRWTIESCRWTIESCRWTIESCRWTIESCRWTIESCTPPAGPFRRSACHIPDRAGHVSVTARAAPELGARSEFSVRPLRGGRRCTRGKGNLQTHSPSNPARLTSTSTSPQPASRRRRPPPQPPPNPQAAGAALHLNRFPPPASRPDTACISCSSPQTTASALPPPVPNFLFRCSQRFLTGQT